MEHQHSRSVITIIIISLTAHWVVQNYKRKSAVLHVIALEGSHIAMYTAKNVRNMLSNRNIGKEKVHLVS